MHPMLIQLYMHYAPQRAPRESAVAAVADERGRRDVDHLRPDDRLVRVVLEAGLERRHGVHRRRRAHAQQGVLLV